MKSGPLLTAAASVVVALGALLGVAETLARRGPVPDRGDTVVGALDTGDAGQPETSEQLVPYELDDNGEGQLVEGPSAEPPLLEAQDPSNGVGEAPVAEEPDADELAALDPAEPVPPVQELENLETEARPPVMEEPELMPGEPLPDAQVEEGEVEALPAEEMPQAEIPGERGPGRHADAPMPAPLPEDQDTRLALLPEAEEEGTSTDLAPADLPREQAEVEEDGGGEADPAQPPERRIVVDEGENLWRLARELYGFGVLYPLIFEANRELIEDPDDLWPGQVLIVPDAPENGIAEFENIHRELRGIR